ncbi:MAG: hypothetical protein CR986_01215 [Ignavibacteriae bacterium]|nr:MAG: hypothetical protein CR986_01215 [Ignavibacteriota bacterium]
MKKEDMKMRLREGNNVFPKDKIFIAIIFIFLSLKIDAQIELNNFGKVNVVKTFPGYKNFTLTDFNKDNVNDIILFGRQSKSFVLHKGIKGSTFSHAIKKFFFYPIDDFKWFNKSKSGTNYYIFISREKRIAGLVSFTKNYSLQLLNTVKFNSYPTSIEICDFTSDGKNEALIYGNNFNGIEIIQNNGYNLNTCRILKQNSFADLSIMDFNQDGMKDIIAIDVLSNSIKFFDNIDNLEFAQSRTIERESIIHSINSFDYNSDSFVDLISVTDNNFEVFYGDSVYSFTELEKSNSQFTHSKLLFNDFNRNDKMDLVSLDKINSSIIFQFDYLTNNNIFKFKVDKVSELKNEKRNILIYKTTGTLYRISDKQKNETDFSIFANNEALKINYATQEKNKSINIIYNSNNESSLSLFNLDDKANLKSLISYDFTNTNNEFGFSDDAKMLIGYTKDSKLLEIINLKNSNKPQHLYFYSRYPVNNFFWNDDNQISLIETNKNNLFLEKVKLHSDYCLTESTNLIDSSLVSSVATTPNNIFFWNKKNTNYSLIKVKNNNRKKIINIKRKNFPKEFSMITNYSNKNEFLTSIKSDSKEKIYWIKNNRYIKLSSKNSAKIILNENNSKLYSSSNKNYLFVSENNFVKKYKINEKLKTITIKDSIKTNNLNDFFITNFFGETYIIYTDTLNNLISFKKFENEN